MRLPVAGLAAVCAASSIASAGAPGYTAEEASRLRRAVTLENWDDGGDISRFVYLNMSQIFPAAVVRRGGPIVPLPVALNPAIGRYVVDTKGDRTTTLQQFVTEGSLDGFIVVHRGRVVYEQYPRMRPDDKHIAFSVTKAFVGMAVALLEDRGQVRVDRPIGEAIRELQGTAWHKASIRDVLEMASGIEGAETGEAYSDPRHKHYQYEASLGWLPKTAAMPEAVQGEETFAYLATLGRVREPGTVWEYASVNTAVLGWLVERVSGKALSDFLSDEFWSRMGAEADALMAVNRNGMAVSHGGLATTLRDLARFGMLFTRGHAPAGGNHVIPDRILRRITTGGRTQLVDPPKGPSSRTHVAYHWDGVTTQGDFYKGGFGGQLLYVAPRKDVVIAYFGTNATLDSPPPRLPLSKMVDDLFPADARDLPESASVNPTGECAASAARRAPLRPSRACHGARNDDAVVLDDRRRFAVTELVRRGGQVVFRTAAGRSSGSSPRFDASENLVKGLRDGQIDALVVQDPINMGYLGLKTLVAHIKGQPVEKRIDTGVRVATKENMDSPDMKDVLHPDLSQWLKP